MKKPIKKEGDVKEGSGPRKNELKTDPPLSEKDEFKEAERRTTTGAKKRS